MNGPRKLYVKSFGCQMNVYDSRRMADTLAPQGYVETASAEDADLIILNTCHIREKAAEKVYSELGRVRRMKEAAAAEGRQRRHRRRRLRRAGRRRRDHPPRAGGRSCVRPAELSPAARTAGARRSATAKPSIPNFRPTTNSIISPRRAARRSARAASSAFVTVQEGCDKFCTFCVVPYTRGAEMSRPVAKILAEVERLADAGVREVTLIGQNVNAYHGEGPDGRPWSLARLLARVAQIDGIDAAALHDQSSARHGRRSNRGASRFAASSCRNCICRCNRAPIASSPR